MKGDDGVGPYVASLLIAHGSGDEDAFRVGKAHVLAIDCAMTPENYTSVIRRLQPSLLVIVDAAEMRLTVGEYRLVPADRIGALGLSTHSMPLSLFMDYVREMVHRTMLIGVQPRTMALGQRLSPEVRRAGDELVTLLSAGTLGPIRALD